MTKQPTAAERGREIVAALRKPVSDRGDGYAMLLKAAGNWVRWEFIQAGIPILDAEGMARDVVTDVAMEKIEQFKGDGELFFGWLRKLVENRIYSRQRVSWRTEPLDEDRHNRPTESHDTAKAMQGLLFRKPLRDALRKLNRVDRRLFYSRADGVPVKVVAAELGLSEGNVKVRYSRIKERLRKILDNAVANRSEEKNGNESE